VAWELCAWPRRHACSPPHLRRAQHHRRKKRSLTPHSVISSCLLFPRRLSATDTFHGPLKKITTHYTAPGMDTDVYPPTSGWNNVTAADGQAPTCYAYDDAKAIKC